jgi:hypothetical protein
VDADALIQGLEDIHRDPALSPRPSFSSISPEGCAAGSGGKLAASPLSPVGHRGISGGGSLTCVGIVSRWYALIITGETSPMVSVCHGLTQVPQHLNLILDFFATTLVGPAIGSPVAVKDVLDTAAAVVVVYSNWADRSVQTLQRDRCSVNGEPAGPTWGSWAEGVPVAAVAQGCATLATRCPPMSVGLLLLIDATALSDLHRSICQSLNLVLGGHWAEVTLLPDYGALVIHAVSAYQLVTLQQATAQQPVPSVVLLPLMDFTRTLFGLTPAAAVASDDVASAAVAGSSEREGSTAKVATITTPLASDDRLWRATVQHVMSALLFGWGHFYCHGSTYNDLHTGDLAKLTMSTFSAMELTDSTASDVIEAWQYMLQVLTEALCGRNAGSSEPGSDGSDMLGHNVSKLSSASKNQHDRLDGAEGGASPRRPKHRNSPAVDLDVGYSHLQQRFQRSAFMLGAQATQTRFEGVFQTAVASLPDEVLCGLWLSSVGLIEDIREIPASIAMAVLKVLDIMHRALVQSGASIARTLYSGCDFRQPVFLNWLIAVLQTQTGTHNSPRIRACQMLCTTFFQRSTQLVPHKVVESVYTVMLRVLRGDDLQLVQACFLHSAKFLISDIAGSSILLWDFLKAADRLIRGINPTRKTSIVTAEPSRQSAAVGGAAGRDPVFQAIRVVTAAACMSAAILTAGLHVPPPSAEESTSQKHLTLPETSSGNAGQSETKTADASQQVNSVLAPGADGCVSAADVSAQVCATLQFAVTNETEQALRVHALHGLAVLATSQLLSETGHICVTTAIDTLLSFVRFVDVKVALTAIEHLSCLSALAPQIKRLYPDLCGSIISVLDRAIR